MTGLGNRLDEGEGEEVKGGLLQMLQVPLVFLIEDRKRNTKILYSLILI